MSSWRRFLSSFLAGTMLLSSAMVVPTIQAAPAPTVEDADSLRFVMDQNLLSSSLGMMVEKPGTDSAVLIAYYLAPLAGNGKASKFKLATGSISINKTTTKGLYAPVVEDISKKWKIDNKAEGANTKVARAKLRDGRATLDIKEPGNTVITVSNNGYRAELPIEVRLPGYSVLQLTYGTKKAPQKLAFGGTEAGLKELEMIKGENWVLSVLCRGGAEQIPGVTSSIYYAVDKGGNGFWYSEDPAVASVTSAGKLKAVAEGKATLVFHDYLGERHYFELTVLPKPTEAYDDFTFYTKAPISATENAYEVAVGKSYTVEFRAMQNNKVKKLSYFAYSSDPSVAYVDSSKNVKGISPGEAVITLVTTGLKNEPQIQTFRVKVVK